MKIEREGWGLKYIETLPIPHCGQEKEKKEKKLKDKKDRHDTVICCPTVPFDGKNSMFSVNCCISNIQQPKAMETCHCRVSCAFSFAAALPPFFTKEKKEKKEKKKDKEGVNLHGKWALGERHRVVKCSPRD